MRSLAIPEFLFLPTSRSGIPPERANTLAFFDRVVEQQHFKEMSL